MLDGYENPNPTTPPPEKKRIKPLVRPIPVISERIIKNIEDLERMGETARHGSFVITPDKGIWRKMGNKTFYRLFGLHYIQHTREKNGVQEAIDKAKSRVWIKDANYSVTTALSLKTGVSIEGESMPQVANVDPTPPSPITFTTNANGDTGTVLSTTGTNDCFTGNLLRTVSITNMGLSGFTNGFNIGVANVLGIAQSDFARIFFANVTTPINVQNFQYLTLRQIYAYCPTSAGSLILAQNNNTNWFGGNSFWSDIFGTGWKNVLGAVKLIAVAGYLNLIECHRLQVNQQDAAFVSSTTGYGLYLQGQSVTALCSNNAFFGLDLENQPNRVVRLEDYANFNHLTIMFDQANVSTGFAFSLKKNLTANPPVSNLLFYHNNIGTCNVESDSFQNVLISSVPLKPVTGAYPAGIIGFGTAIFNGAQFSTMFGGGPGHDFVGATTNNLVASTSTVGNITTFALPTGAFVQNIEVGGDLKITSFTSGTIQIQVSYTDRDATAQTIILPLISDAGAISASAGATGNFRTPTVTLAVNTAPVTVKTIGNIVGTWEASGFVRATA